MAGETVLPLLFGAGINSFAKHTLYVFATIVIAYLLLAFFVWLLSRGRSVQLDHDAIHDLRLSFNSAVIFSMALAAVLQLHSLGYTRIYDHPSDYGWWYIGVSYLIALWLQDSYFYGIHRLFHSRKFYRLTHKGHHKTRQSSPWTSLAFDAAEAFAHAVFFVTIVCVLPLHLGTILAALATMTIWAVVNHLGLEHLPVRFPHHWLGRWIIGPAHHSVHHSYQNKHFGLYFTFWDRVMGTEDPDYRYRLSKIPAQPPSADTFVDQ